MANRNKARHGRSRKRRRAASPPRGNAPAALREAGVETHKPDGRAAASRAASAASAANPSKQARTRNRRRPPPRRRSGGGMSGLLPMGERPQAPWHPLPLSELLILGGAIGFFFGLQSGFSHGRAPLIVGLVALLVGTVEVTLREHLSGYRSHAIIIAILPVIVLDSAVVLLVSPIGATVKVLMLLFDAALFAFLYKVLRLRFLDARRQRVFAGGR